MEILGLVLNIKNLGKKKSFTYEAMWYIWKYDTTHFWLTDKTYVYFSQVFLCNYLLSNIHNYQDFSNL